MAREDAALPPIASPTIEQVFKEFLAEQEQRLKPKTLRKYESIISLLRSDLNSYAYEGLSKEESALFDKCYAADGEGHREFCQLFGPDKIMENLSFFLNFSMIRKVMCGAELKRAAGAVMKKLSKWLAEKGYIGRGEATDGAEKGAEAARLLPMADRAAEILAEAGDFFFDPNELPDEDYLDFDRYTITKMEPGKLWLEGFVSGEGVVGPIAVPRKAHGPPPGGLGHQLRPGSPPRQVAAGGGRERLPKVGRRPPPVELPALAEETEVRVDVPEASDVLARIEEVPSRLHGQARAIRDWRRRYAEDVSSARDRPSIQIFRRFVGGGLLERAMPGETYERRIEEFPNFFHAYEDITEDRIRQFLTATCYRFPASGLSVVMEAKRIVTSPGFTWRAYFEDAERNYQDDFRGDEFLRIKHVSFKTRDLGLSEFSPLFVAVDLHVARVTVRTGLLVHGYGDPAISTNQQSEGGYLFLHSLLLKLSEATGWPGDGYSPGEIDRMFWFFGRAVCRATPRCDVCPVAEICLTARASVA